MKRLNLDDTWTECLKMWRWIIKQIKKGRRSIEALKAEWIKNHSYEDIQANCFFCNYRPKDYRCSSCPAKKIDPSFGCRNDEYHFRDKPLAFLAKLVELNKIRLKRKTKK